MAEHRQTWQKLVEREHLDPQAFDYATWTFASRKIFLIFLRRFGFFLYLDNSLRSPNDRQGDLSKARRFGWTTIVDTFDGYVECFQRLKQLKVIP